MKLLLPLLPLAFGQSLFQLPGNKPPIKTATPQAKTIARPIIQPVQPMMDPMMMLLLLQNQQSSSTSTSSSSNNNLLLMMMMMQQQPYGAAPGVGGKQQINPMMMSLLLQKKASDCKLSFTSAFTKLSLLDQKKVARGDYFYKLPVANKAAPATKYAAVTAITDAGFVTAASAITQADAYPDNWFDHLDYEFISCEAKANKKSTTDTLLPMMMMQSGAMGMNDPMMMLMLLGDTQIKDLLPIMMMSKQEAGKIDPLFMTLILDTKKTKVDCDAEYYLDKSWTITQDTADKDKFTITKNTIARTAFDKNQMTTTFTLKTGGTKVSPYAKVAARTWPDKYIKCLNAATSEGTAQSSLQKLLPLMMMGQQKPGQPNNMFSNPLMMLLLLKK